MSNIMSEILKKYRFKLIGKYCDYSGEYSNGNDSNCDDRYLLECPGGHKFAINVKQQSQITGCPQCKIEEDCKFPIVLQTYNIDNIYINHNSWIRGKCADCDKTVFVTSNLINNNQKNSNKFNHCEFGHMLPRGKSKIIKTMEIFERFTGKQCERTHLFGRYHPTAFNSSVDFALLHTIDTKGKQSGKKPDESQSTKYISMCESVCKKMGKMLLVIPDILEPEDIEYILHKKSEIFASN